MMTEYHITITRETIEESTFIVHCSNDEAADTKAAEIAIDLENHGIVSQDEPDWQLESQTFDIKEVV